MTKNINFFKPYRADEDFRHLTYEEIIQKFANARGIIIAVSAMSPQALPIEEGEYVRRDLAYDVCDGPGTHSQRLPYEEGIQRTVDQRELIIAVRPVNKMAFQLINEGYDTKKLALKAKSSSEGVTAGFIVQEPLFGKNGKKDAAEQAKRIQKSLDAGCGLVPLHITGERIRLLVDEHLISIDAEFKEQGANIKTIKSIYDGDLHCFQLKQSQDDPLFWEVWHNNKPLMALTNPGETGKKAAVTADYDLFGIYPHKNQSVVNRPLTIYPQLKENVNPNIQQRWQQTLDSRNQGNGAMAMDPEKGNISIPEMKIIEELNKEIKRAGYKGTSLVWHGTETANPYTPGPDFPLRVYSPGETHALMISNQKELMDFYHRLQDSPFHAEENAAFRMKAF